MQIIWGHTWRLDYKPIVEYWNCSFYNIPKWYYPNPGTSNIVVIHCCHVPCIFFIVFCVTSQGLNSGHQRFSSIASDQIEMESRKTPLWWHWTPKTTDMRLDSLAQSMTWEGLTWPWPPGQSWLWPLPNKKYMIRRGLMRTVWLCLNFGSAATFGGVIN